MPTGIIGIVVIVAVAVLLSENRRHINWRIILSTLALQVAIAAFALITPIGQSVLQVMSFGVQNIINYANEGLVFIFGPLADPQQGFILAIQVLPVIIFVSSLLAILYHFGIMQVFVKVFGAGLRAITGIPRLEAVCAAANVFVGMIEAPLTIRPYLPHLTRAQLFSVMCTGLATVAGAMMVGYASLGVELPYLITAAFMGAPGGLLMAKLLIPETGVPYDPEDSVEVNPFGEGEKPVNFIDAAAIGAQGGLRITVMIVGMLLAFVALIALANGIIGGIGGVFGQEDISLERILGFAFAPVCFLIGIPWEEAIRSGVFFGQKTILNEFLAYANFAPVKETFSETTQAIITVALCGFASLPALAILMGGLGSMIPSRRSEIATLGLKTVFASTLANLMSAAITGVLISLQSLF